MTTPLSNPHLAAKDRKNAEKRTLVVGCGYLGQCVAQLAAKRGGRLWGTTRSEAKAKTLADNGIPPVIIDWTQPQTLSDLPEVDQVVVAVSYDRNSQQDRYESQVGGLQNLLSVLPPHVNVCYISTTGVYHQTDGSWVDEDSPTDPNRPGGRVHLQAEQLLRDRRNDSPWSILRLAGIYGPHRIPRAADVIAGRPIVSSPDGYLNLIHVHDAAHAVLASWEQDQQKMYVVCDDQPVIRREFYQEIAIQTGSDSPTFQMPTPDSPDRVRFSSSKRIRNERFRKELAPALLFPTYKQGLAAIFAQAANFPK